MKLQVKNIVFERLIKLTEKYPDKDWDYIISQNPNEDDETYTIDNLKEFISNKN